MQCPHHSMTELPNDLVSLLERFVSPVSARAMVRNAISKAKRKAGGPPGNAEVLRQIELSTNILVPPSQRDNAKQAIRAALEPKPAPEPELDDEPVDESVVIIREERDLVAVRMIARDACKIVGVRGYNAQKIVTVVSELARNIARYVGDGRVRFRVDPNIQKIVVIAEDEGPGIPNVEEILAGNYKSKTGLGRGLIGAKKIAESFELETSSAGTRVTVSFNY